MKNISKPLANIPVDQQVFSEAHDVLYKAYAMGLIDKPVNILQMDISAIKTILKEIAKGGIAERVLIDVDRWDINQPQELLKKLKILSSVLEESPNPMMEWWVARQYFSDELLSQVVDVSKSCIPGYVSCELETPPPVCCRLHMVAMIIGDLAGTYSHEGIRQWFTRPRKEALGGCSPVELLNGEWLPEDPNPTRVREFAYSLGHSVTT